MNYCDECGRYGPLKEMVNNGSFSRCEDECLETIDDYCEDCNLYGILILENACGNSHRDTTPCCLKWICAAGCRFKCTHCGRRATTLTKSTEGWHYQRPCKYCEKAFVPKFEWLGDPPHHKCKWDGDCCGRLRNIDPVTGDLVTADPVNT